MSDWNPGPAWLFCPADRPDRYGKALAAADVVILDLEDAVASESKAAARDGLRELASTAEWTPSRTVLRLNPSGTKDHETDIALLRDLELAQAMLAKTESRTDVERVPAGVVALVETPRGIQQVDDIASASNAVGIFWGADDLVAGLGGSSSRNSNGRFRDIARHARSGALIAAKANDLLALDAVHMDIRDLEGLAAECRDAAAIGFDATAAIHPSQVATIRAAYAPTPEAIDWAARLLAHVGDNRGVTTFEGRMVDGPIYTQAEHIIRLSAQHRSNP